MSTVTYPHIALIGRAGAGKTTTAALLVKEHGYERLSFARPLKVMCGTATDRGLLQRVGLGVRELVPDGWVNLLIHDKAAREQRWLEVWPGDNEPRFVVDDCRFENEAWALKREGFIIVRIVAPTTTRIARLKAIGKLQDEAQMEHVSETALDDFQHDYSIVNDGWPDHLALEITRIMNAAAQ